MNEIKDFIDELTQVSKQKATVAVQKVEQMAHKDPWGLVLIFAAMGGLFGFLFGKLSSHHRKEK